MLSENIKTLRKAKGMSQEDLANELHVVRQTVSKWEKNLSVPDAGMLINIAEVLETTVNALLGEAIPEPDEKAEIKAISEKLESINEKLASMAERRRKISRAFFAGAGVLSILILAKGLIRWLYGIQSNGSLQYSTGIIGGADGPTSILVSTEFHYEYKIVAAMAAVLICCIGMYKTKKK